MKISPDPISGYLRLELLQVFDSTCSKNTPPLTSVNPACSDFHGPIRVLLLRISFQEDIAGGYNCAINSPCEPRGKLVNLPLIVNREAESETLSDLTDTI